MEGQLGIFPNVEPLPQPQTYVSVRPDGKVVHCQAFLGHIGQEYEHDDPNWQPPPDWPYEVIDLRKRR